MTICIVRAVDFIRCKENINENLLLRTEFASAVLFEDSGIL
jgi:hypothetical protein